MQKWEYCVIAGVRISGIGSVEAYYPRLSFFSINGISSEIDLCKGIFSKRPKGWENSSEGEYLAHTIADLGLKGWEMVGTGISEVSELKGSHCLYFRRPIE